MTEFERLRRDHAQLRWDYARLEQENQSLREQLGGAPATIRALEARVEELTKQVSILSELAARSVERVQELEQILRRRTKGAPTPPGGSPVPGSLEGERRGSSRTARARRARS